jgi:hypothetical protein
VALTLDPTVEIDGDGLKLGTWTPALGHPFHIAVNVTGVLRMAIKWSDPGAGSVWSAGTLVIGNGQLSAAANYHPTASASPNS